MTKGKIKWYDDVKGYGFIATENGADVFVHRTSLSNPYANLETDQEVEFETKQGDKGLVAINVKISE